MLYTNVGQSRRISLVKNRESTIQYNNSNCYVNGFMLFAPAVSMSDSVSLLIVSRITFSQVS